MYVFTLGAEYVKKLKLYLDASAIGYLDEQTSPNEMNDMLALWTEIQQGRYSVILSEVTLNELNANKNRKKVNILINYLADISYNIVKVDLEIERIAELVKTNGLLLSDKKRNDRLHIGCAIVSGCDILVSYNFKDLANVMTIKGVRGVSSISGYGNIDIVPAAMLIGKGDD